MCSRIKVTDTARQYAYTDNEVLVLEWNGREIRNGKYPNPFSLSLS